MMGLVKDCDCYHKLFRLPCMSSDGDTFCNACAGREEIMGLVKDCDCHYNVMLVRLPSMSSDGETFCNACAGREEMMGLVKDCDCYHNAMIRTMVKWSCFTWTSFLIHESFDRQRCVVRGRVRECTGASRFGLGSFQYPESQSFRDPGPWKLRNSNLGASIAMNPETLGILCFGDLNIRISEFLRDFGISETLKFRVLGDS